jgi:hypothetical protein
MPDLFDRLIRNAFCGNFHALQLWRTCALLVVLMGCFYACTAQVAGVDFWLQAKVGELIAVSHEIPSTLLFPYTEIAEQHFNAHEWLSSIAFHGLLTALGTAGLPLVHSVLGLFLLGMAVWLGMVRSGGNWATSLLGGLLAVAVENYRHVLRPELIATLLLMGYWLVLERLRLLYARRYILLALLVEVVWANVHGSFILGPLLAGIYVTGNHIDTIRNRHNVWAPPTRSTQLLAGVTLASLAACLVNPFGVEMLQFVVSFSTDPALRTIIGEWMPTFHTRWVREPGWWIAIIVWLASAWWICWRRKNISAIDLLVFLFFSTLAVKAIRFPVYLGIVAAYLLGGLQPDSWAQLQIQIRIFKGTLVLGLVLSGLVAAYGNAYGARPYSYGLYRLGPDMEAALSNPAYQGNVLNSMELGAELIYRGYPRLRPTIDCRVDSYGMEYYKYTLALLGSRELLQEFVDRYHVRYMLYENVRLMAAIKAGTFDERQWRILAQDKRFVFMEYRPYAAAPPVANSTTP